ncbi:hypothetical protein H5410_061858 [Solanum commersonii]|uniref:Uncharacterized protein n=1 Tax=Solanum commersonii TaxID=4109 RepID=A0A9J5WA01_SOLCO|nr:hypothetical protein H5410_061858 [Solanum commersonii]
MEEHHQKQKAGRFRHQKPYASEQSSLGHQIKSNTIMNQAQLNVDTNVIQVVIGLTRAIGPRMSKRARLIWYPD